MISWEVVGGCVLGSILGLVIGLVIPLVLWVNKTFPKQPKGDGVSR